jgi:hypothetical protein
MRRRNWLLIFAILAAVSLALPTWTNAQGGWPTIDPAVVDQVIGQTSTRSFAALGAPAAALETIRRGQAGARLAELADTAAAVSVFRPGVGLLKTVIPTRGQGRANLAPDTQTTDDNRPARLVGTVFEPGVGARQVVVVWGADPNAPPEEVRFYDSNNQRIADPDYSRLVVRRLRGDDSGFAAPIDQGVLVAARETCYTVGLEQACVAPETFTPDAQSVARATDAAKLLGETYAFDVEFDLDGAVSELVGARPRQACARSMGALRSDNTRAVRGCDVNLVFTGVLEQKEDQPIGLFNVLANADMDVFDLQGKPVNRLPAGAYLVVDVTPQEAREKPGSAGVLLLANADGQTHFLLPSRVMEGFGAAEDPGAEIRRGQAAIKYGVLGAQGF